MKRKPISDAGFKRIAQTTNTEMVDTEHDRIVEAVIDYAQHDFWRSVEKRLNETKPKEGWDVNLSEDNPEMIADVEGLQAKMIEVVEEWYSYSQPNKTNDFLSKL